MLEDAQMDLVDSALAWLARGHRVAVATVTSTRGSSPRPVGSQLVIRDDGAFLGSVSGGCVEGAVVTAAQQVIESGTPQALHFGAAEDDVLGVGLACGGQIDVLVTAVEAAPLRELQRAWQEQLPCCAVISAHSGRWSVAVAGGSGCESFTSSIEFGTAGWVDGQSEATFARPYVHPRRLVIVGAVHIAQALSRMAHLAGLQPIVVDPRQAFATTERFAEAQLVARWPQRAFDELQLDARTAVVALTHDPKIDDPALRRALESSAFYIGALGSRKTHAARLERLRQLGFSELQLSRIHGPVGLSIGAITPAEIAVSILAEITERLRQGPRHHFSAVVLAAGQSTRAGAVNKLLHSVDGRPMIARVVDTVSSSRVDDVVVITGHDADAVRDCLGSHRVRFVHNPNFAAGMSTSIRVGIDAVGDADAACIVLGDMPWLERAHINALLAAFDPPHRSICVPEFEGRPGNPVLWARDHFPALRRLSGDRGAKSLWEANSGQVRRVAVESPAIHRDVDDVTGIP